VPAQRLTLTGWEQRVAGTAATLGKPFGAAGRRSHLSAVSRASCALTQDPDVAAGAEVDVADAQANQFGDADPGLDHQREQRAVAAAEPGAPLGSASSPVISLRSR
jgi:hypothetical protein